MLAISLVGHISMQSVLHPPEDPDDVFRFEGRGRLWIEGVVVESPYAASDRTEIVLDTRSVLVDHDPHAVRGKVLLVMREKVDSFRYGDFLRVETKLRIPAGYKNPGAFDYARFLLLKGIRLQGFVDHPSAILLIREHQGNALRQRIESYRYRLRDIIRQATPEPDSGILEALIVGERGGIPKEIQETFNRTGTAHILSISGLHIGIIAMASLWLIRIILKRSEYLLLRFSLIKPAAFLSLVPVLFYAFVAGMSIPTVRSVIMVLSFLIAVLLGRSRELLNALGLAAFLILLFSPASLFDISFQLSFTAVFSILCLTPKLADIIPRRYREIPEGPKWRAWCGKAFLSLALFLAASLAATLGTAPLVAYYFNRVSLVALPANLVAVPLLGFVVLILGLAAMVISFFSTAGASMLFHGASFFVRPSLWFLDLMDRLPGSSVIVTTPTIAEIAAFYFLIGVIAYGLSVRRLKGSTGSLTDHLRLHRGPAALSLALLLFFIADGTFLFLKDRNPGRLRVTFLDVGHGNASLVEFPGGRRMLIDGGGSFDGRFDFGRYVVAPFLWKNRIHKIDTVVLTHPHPDHIGGLPFILENFAVEEVWVNGEQGEDPSFETFNKRTEEKKIPMKTVSALNGPVEVQDVSFRVLHPLKPISPRQPVLSDRESNNESLVLKITFRDIGILLCGDIATPAETALLHSGADLKSSVLLVPHHGARQSCTEPFLMRVRPEHAVISARETSFSRTPHPEVVERLERSGIKIYRTDLHGAVTVETDGQSVRITTHKPLPE
jgi:competence protein ComEC